MDTKFNKYIAPSAATALLLAIGGSACGESLKASPCKESKIYPGDPNAHSANPANWDEVVVAKTNVVADAKEVIVGFEDPGSDYWKYHKPIDPTEAGILLFRIGPGPVKFRIKFRGESDSKAVIAAPQVIFEGPEPISKAISDYKVREPSTNGWESKQQYDPNCTKS
ncbi:hypothetical protein KW794_02105 [Candidatus Saccharibacteria bacterium]|nr:hypothetical protein [Candidatus Saccharibacteria bacterium]